MQLRDTFSRSSESDVISWFYSILRLRNPRKYEYEENRGFSCLKIQKLREILFCPTQVSRCKRIDHAGETSTCASKFPCCSQDKVWNMVGRTAGTKKEKQHGLYLSFKR